jgi:hypothetical protein
VDQETREAQARPEAEMKQYSHILGQNIEVNDETRTVTTDDGCTYSMSEMRAAIVAEYEKRKAELEAEYAARMFRDEHKRKHQSIKQEDGNE